MPALVFPPDATKTDQRRMARAVRARAARAGGEAAGLAIARNLLRGIPLRPGEIVAGYWPIADEADPLPTLLRLWSRGHRLALPCVVRAGKALAFREWRPGDPMRPSRFGIPEPMPRTPEVRPRLVLVPGLCFDRAGGRLGYGGGFYDRTLERLRADGRTHAVGIAYSAQVTEMLPRDPHDQPLDRLVTERGTIRCSPSW